MNTIMLTEHETSYPFVFKLLVLGDSDVGKSCLLHRYTDNAFTLEHNSTIGVDFRQKIVSLNGEEGKLEIWDTAGQERYRNIVATYYRGAHGMLLVFDVTIRESFNHCQKWLYEIKANSETDVCVVLVGNKADQVKERLVAEAEVRSWATINGLIYVETSARDGTGVEEAFLNLAKACMNKWVIKELEDDSEIREIKYNQCCRYKCW